MITDAEYALLHEAFNAARDKLRRLAAEQRALKHRVDTARVMEKEAARRLFDATLERMQHQKAQEADAGLDGPGPLRGDNYAEKVQAITERLPK